MPLERLKQLTSTYDLNRLDQEAVAAGHISSVYRHLLCSTS